MRHQGRIDESLTTFQAALCLNPCNVNNLKQVAQSLYLLGLPFYWCYYMVFYSSTLLVKFSIILTKGKHKNALDVYEEAERLSPEDRDIYHNRGMCYLYLVIP